MNNSLKDSLEYHKKWINDFLYMRLETINGEEMSKESISYLIDDIQHAIDHIITDHCNEE